MYRAMIMIVNVDEASKGSVRSGQGVIVAVLEDSGALESWFVSIREKPRIRLRPASTSVEWWW